MPDRFPQEAVLRDGRRLMVRPFTAQDAEVLYEFFQRLPIEIRRVAWDNVDDPSLVEFWGRNVDHDKVLPLIAFDGTKIVAEATLHYRRVGPLRLVGRIKWLLDPEVRGLGLGTLMVNNFIAIAQKNGLRHISCMLVRELEEDAIETLQGLGFSSYVIPGYGTGPDGYQHDMVMMILRL